MSNSNKIKNKNHRSLLVKFLGLFQSEQITTIPNWLNEERNSDQKSKSNAASKILKFAKEVNLTQSKLLEIYQIECEYEEKKHEAFEQFPHLPQIMNKDISGFRSLKIDKLKLALTKSQFDVYSKLFRKNKQHY